MERIAVIGAGSWGTTLAALWGRTHDVTLWCRSAELCDDLRSTRLNHRYGVAVPLPESVRIFSDLEVVTESADVVVIAVPTRGVRGVADQLLPALPAEIPLVSLSKGIEQESNLRPSQILSSYGPRAIAVFTGPNLASEVAAGLPTSSVLACEDEQAAGYLRETLSLPSLRVYTNTDVVGCEVAGATKNVIALAAGMATGLALGHNAQAALVTRGLVKLTRLGVAAGGRPETFSGLAGLGDLVLTCTSRESRNFTAGMLIGEGRSLDDVRSSSPMVAEGLTSAAGVAALAEQYKVEMPIVHAVRDVLGGQLTPVDAVNQLMRRDPKAE